MNTATMNHDLAYLTTTGEKNEESATLKLLIEQQQAILSKFLTKQRSQEEGERQ